MEGVKYLTDERGKRIEVQIELKKHKKFIYDYLEYIEDSKELSELKDEELIPFDEVIAKFEKVHGKSL